MAASTSDASSGPRQCRCPLCGQLLVAQSEEECVAHFESCEAFSQVHPEGGGPPNTDYFEQQKREMRRQREARQRQPPPTREEIQQLNVRALRQLISAAGLSHEDCLEKGDLRARAEDAADRLRTGDPASATPAPAPAAPP